MNRRDALILGARKAAILRSLDLDGDRCECGQWADGRHPPLPKPLPWAHGRPCALTSLDRGHGHHRSPNAFGGARP